MLAVHLEEGVVHVREQPLPHRPAGFALIRLLSAGICNTDLELQRGYYGFAGIPGHEFVGEVTESETRELIGKRVVGEINLACGECDWCRRGLGRHCSRRTVLGIVAHPGAFAEYFTLPEGNLHVLSEKIPTETAVFTEPVAAACEILEQVRPSCSCCMAVLGDGKLGLLIAQVLRAHGYEVHQFGRHADKLRIAEAAGVRTYLPNHDAPVAEYDWVVEATGSPDGLLEAIRMTRPRGTIVLKSTIHAGVPIDMAPVIVNEITLVGSRCGRFEPALELLERQVVNVQPMIAARFKLADAPQAFQRAAEKGTLKVLLEP